MSAEKDVAMATPAQGRKRSDRQSDANEQACENWNARTQPFCSLDKKKKKTGKDLWRFNLSLSDKGASRNTSARFRTSRTAQWSGRSDVTIKRTDVTKKWNTVRALLYTLAKRIALCHNDSYYNIRHVIDVTSPIELTLNSKIRTWRTITSQEA